MAELSTLARPYAKAAFEYARDAGELAAWEGQLATAAAVVADPAMAAMLGNPALTNEQQANTLIEVCGDALAIPARNFVSILADNKRLALLPEIYSQFALFKANQEKSVDVEVISAFDLDDAARDKIAAALGKKLEREVKVSTSTDENLLGGVLIRAGDLVIDGSVRGRLNKLAEAMNL
ncbi:F0F1 ATP synthase subunit delta [Parahaliea aestuarii]|uniref:ATP synthase subunit delta n=1 Tax=Parahaliea aestuarii TaxID=1852021 RepID=A0A5C8ZYP6_9GAMM|nr:F0F1 ATP synthase subunit delta [Parahaliea aestuarii]TXS92371.1 F0F1 ATP synthase subunit delta [Parahaliea aestuarii]